MCRLDQGLDAETYLEILKDEFQQTRQYYFGKELVVLQQDNSPVHTAGLVKKWFEEQNIEILPWPSNSPDLNPIENYWADIKRRVRVNHDDATSKEKLWEAIQYEHEKTPKEFCQTLTASMPARLTAVLKAKGAHTKY